MDKTIRFWDRMAPGYSKRPVADEATYQRKLEITRDYLRPDDEILEIGCGTGSTALAHAPHVRHIRATDVSANMLAIAREKAREANIDNVEFERSSIDELDVAPASVDIILALSILHLLDNRRAVIGRLYDMLKPGGHLISSTACLGDSHYRFIGLVAPLGRLLGLLPILEIFTADELIAEMTVAGFEIDHEWRPGKGKAVFIVARKPTGD